MGDYTVAKREDAFDFMAQYPGFGEMRSFTDALGAEQVALTWRRMPEDTGGRGSYGHRHRTQEEIYFVVSGKVAFKLGDDVFEAGPGTAVRVPPEVLRSVHNDGPDEAQLIICSPRVDDPAADTEQVDDFWPTD
ncbi:MAG TPA: cupin domain-containing protein [Solirubrobacterales bacterium]|nr:cupin domain-containing protein [Solirubrobacterales bacterium]